MVFGLKPPVQNLIMISLNAERSVEGSEVMAFLSTSYDQFVVPELILLGAFVIVE